MEMVPFLRLAAVAALALAACGESVTAGSINSTASRTGCPFDAVVPNATPSSLLVVANGAALTQVWSDHSVRAAFVFGAGLGLPDTAVNLDQVLARDGFVAAHALIVSPRDRVLHEIVLLDPTGAIVWQVRYANSTSPSLFLGANGALSVDTNEGTLVREGSWVVGADRVPRNLGTVCPLAAPGPDGRVPVRRGPLFRTQPSAFGWFDPRALAFVPFAHSLEQQDATIGRPPLWVGGRLVYRSRDGGSLSLVLEAMDGSTVRVPLMGVPGDTVGPWISASTDSGWLLVGRNMDNVLVRINARTAEQSLVPPQPPAGMHLSATRTPNRLLDDGSLLASFAGTTEIQTYRARPESSAWEPLGRPVAALRGQREASSRLSADYAEGTTLVSTFDTMGFATSLRSSQVFRPADRVMVELPTRDVRPDARGQVPVLSRDGRCVAWWEHSATEHTLHAFDARLGQQLTVLTTTRRIGVPLWMR